VLVDLLRLAVTHEKSAEHTHTTDPNHLLGHTGVRGTLSLSSAGVTTLSASHSILAHASARVHSDWLADDQTVLDQFANVLTCI